MDSSENYNNEEEEPVIITLDQTCLSLSLHSKFNEQRTLHMEWVREMELFNARAIAIPLEYCVDPNKSIWGQREGNGFKDKKSPSTEPEVEGNGLPNKKRKTVDEIDSLSVIPLELRSNKDHMMLRVKENGMFLHFAHPDLLHDEQIVLEAVRNHGKSFEYASTALKTNENFVRKAISINGDAFCHLYREWRGRIDLFEIAMKTSGKIFSRAEGNIKSSIYHALQCVSKHWQVIYHFESESPYYPTLIQAIIESDIPVDELVNSNLISNKDLMLKYLFMKSNKSFVMAKEEITLDEEIIGKVLENNLTTANYLTLRQLRVIIKNEELINKIIKHPGVNINEDKASQIINYSTPENIKFLISKYPHYYRMISIEDHIIDPFILRHFPVKMQVSYFENNKHELMKDTNRNLIGEMGYLINSTDQNVANLQKRFEKSHPDLVIPWHRFRNLSPLSNIFTIQNIHELD